MMFRRGAETAENTNGHDHVIEQFIGAFYPSSLHLRHYGHALTHVADVDYKETVR